MATKKSNEAGYFSSPRNDCFLKYSLREKLKVISRRKGLNQLLNSQSLDFVKAPVSEVVRATTQLFRARVCKLIYGQSLSIRDCSTYLFYQFIDSEWTTIEMVRYKNFRISDNIKDLIKWMNSQYVYYYTNDTGGFIGYEWFDAEEKLGSFFYQSNCYDSDEIMNLNYKFIDDFLISKNIYAHYAQWSSSWNLKDYSRGVLIEDQSLSENDFHSIYCVEFG